MMFRDGGHLCIDVEDSVRLFKQRYFQYVAFMANSGRAKALCWHAYTQFSVWCDGGLFNATF